MNKNFAFILSFTLISALCFASPIFAVNVQGEVSGTWAAEEGYLVVGDLEVPDGDSLIIKPGILVTFTDDYSFTVYGTLYAVGEEDDSVRFSTYSQGRGSWDGFTFSGSHANGSQLKYCSIPYAYVGVTVDNSSPKISNSRISHTQTNCVVVEGGAPAFTDCIIANPGTNEVNAAKVTDRGIATFERCDFSGVYGSGVVVGSNSTANVLDCNFYNMGLIGIRLASALQCSLSGNFIDHPGQRGISIEQGNRHGVYRNIVDNAASGTGIWVYRASEINVINNTVVNNSQHGIQTYQGSAKIINNIVMSNGEDGIVVQETQFEAGYNDVYANSDDNYNGLEAPATDISVSPGLDHNYTPQDSSAVVDAGDPRYRDPDGTRADIGARFFNKNIPPTIVEFSPEDASNVQGDQEITFSVTAVDSNEHYIFYYWYLQGNLVSTTNSFTHIFTRDGEYTVKVLVDDGYYLGQVSHAWDVEVFGSSAPRDYDAQPVGFFLSQACPNPFNSSASLELTVYSASVFDVNLFDLMGRKVASLYQGNVQPGTALITVNGLDLPQGYYIVKAQGTEVSQVRRLLLLK